KHCTVMLHSVCFRPATRVLRDSIAHRNVVQLLPPTSIFTWWHRSVSSSHIVRSESNNDSSKGIQVNYITKDGEKIVAYGKEGDNVMHLAQRSQVYQRCSICINFINSLFCRLTLKVRARPHLPAVRVMFT